MIEIVLARGKRVERTSAGIIGHLFRLCDRAAEGGADNTGKGNHRGTTTNHPTRRQWRYLQRSTPCHRSSRCAARPVPPRRPPTGRAQAGGIDTILAKSGCAKASLYSNFESKVELAIAFLDKREAVWTREWLEAEVKKRASDPKERLLAIFDVFDGWFRKKTFEGCSFINVLLESNADSPVRRAAAVHLSKIRAIVRGLAEDAKLREPEKFAQAWHMLMKGSIISACEGNRNAPAVS